MPKKSLKKDIGELLLGGLLSLAAHEGGHKLKAHKLGEDITFDGLDWTMDKWPPPRPPERRGIPEIGVPIEENKNIDIKRRETNLGKISGAGFSLQSLLSDAVPNENLGRKFKALSGLHLLGRAIEPRKPFKTGDLDTIESVYDKKTKDFMRIAMGLAGAEDIYKAKTGKSLLGENSDLSFATDKKTGTPMLMYKKRF